MTVLMRLLIAAIAAYIVIGLVYSTWWTPYIELNPSPNSDILPPWSGPIAFLAWFVLPAALWPWNLIGFHRVPRFSRPLCIWRQSRSSTSPRADARRRAA